MLKSTQYNFTTTVKIIFNIKQQIRANGSFHFDNFNIMIMKYKMLKGVMLKIITKFKYPFIFYIRILSRENRKFRVKKMTNNKTNQAIYQYILLSSL